jgi:hypothetical protein
MRSTKQVLIIGALGIYAIGTGVGIIYYNNKKPSPITPSSLDSSSAKDFPNEIQRRNIFNELAANFDSRKL